MDDRKHSISTHAIDARLGESAPITVDVRRDSEFVGADTLIALLPLRSQDHGKPWRPDLPSWHLMGVGVFSPHMLIDGTPPSPLFATKATDSPPDRKHAGFSHDPPSATNPIVHNPNA